MANMLFDICCPDEGSSCIKDFCNDAVRVSGAMVSVAIIENDSPPEIGDSVTYFKNGASVTELITEGNYADLLYEWLMMKQKSCNSRGRHYHYLSPSLLNAIVRGETTLVNDENAGPWVNAAPMGYEGSIELTMGQSYPALVESICSLLYRRSKISLIYFYKEAVQVLSYKNNYTLKVSNSTTLLSGNSNDPVKGKLIFSEKGKCEPRFHYAIDKDEFLEKLSNGAKYTFGDFVLDGLTEVSCYTGNCVTYETTANTPFSLIPTLDTNACAEFKLFKNCTDEITENVLVNDLTGEIVAADGLPVGVYKYTIHASNPCCVSGNTCFIVRVK